MRFWALVSFAFSRNHSWLLVILRKEEEEERAGRGRTSLAFGSVAKSDSVCHTQRITLVALQQAADLEANGKSNWRANYQRFIWPRRSVGRRLRKTRAEAEALPLRELTPAMGGGEMNSVWEEGRVQSPHRQ